MAEVKYYEAVVNVSGTTRLGVYARSEEEAEKLLDEYAYSVGVDRFSTDLDLDDCVVDSSSISEYVSEIAYEVINSEEEFEEETNDSSL